jgi:hypothetical protein
MQARTTRETVPAGQSQGKQHREPSSAYIIGSLFSFGILPLSLTFIEWAMPNIAKGLNQYFTATPTIHKSPRDKAVDLLYKIRLASLEKSGEKLNAVSELEIKSATQNLDNKILLSRLKKAQESGLIARSETWIINDFKSRYKLDDKDRVAATENKKQEKAKQITLVCNNVIKSLGIKGDELKKLSPSQLLRKIDDAINKGGYFKSQEVDAIYDAFLSPQDAKLFKAAYVETPWARLTLCNFFGFTRLSTEATNALRAARAATAAACG